jgi:hypothetical protein
MRMPARLPCTRAAHALAPVQGWQQLGQEVQLQLVCCGRSTFPRGTAESVGQLDTLASMKCSCTYGNYVQIPVFLFTHSHAADPTQQAYACLATCTPRCLHGLSATPTAATVTCTCILQYNCRLGALWGLFILSWDTSCNSCHQLPQAAAAPSFLQDEYTHPPLESTLF